MLRDDVLIFGWNEWEVGPKVKIREGEVIKEKGVSRLQSTAC